MDYNLERQSLEAHIALTQAKARFINAFSPLLWALAFMLGLFIGKAIVS